MLSLQTQLLTAARNQCDVLASLKASPLNELKKLFEQLVTANATSEELKQVVDGLLSLKNPSARKEQLAELLYFCQGRLNLVGQNFNSLTRLQMEHEVLTHGLVTFEKLPTLTEWGLRLQLATQVYRPAPMPFCFDTAYDSGYYSRSEDEDCSSDEDEEAYYVIKVNQKTGLNTTFYY